MRRSIAISLLDRPSATRAATSRSRRVSGSPLSVVAPVSEARTSHIIAVTRGATDRATQLGDRAVAVDKGGKPGFGAGDQAGRAAGNAEADHAQVRKLR